MCYYADVYHPCGHTSHPRRNCAAMNEGLRRTPYFNCTIQNVDTTVPASWAGLHCDDCHQQWMENTMQAWDVDMQAWIRDGLSRVGADGFQAEITRLSGIVMKWTAIVRSTLNVLERDTSLMVEGVGSLYQDGPHRIQQLKASAAEEMGLSSR